ncbi:MAG TPA: heparan-alpha-glucosaminide N-acetyltransferase domain-containing protein [Gemmatimonadaceae bacterium]|jgi:uncharacterized membrane protein|nr:heparan-alpha-glucosaminide N-acetyltransferase domain-containing protein [Gemmatimonadaceae bacterium]
MTTPATLTRERTAAPAGAGPRSPRTRIDSVDVVRGLVMILMALDHTRDFFGSRADPTNVATTTAALFFTRWVTHVCAPTFFLLTGAGAALSLGRKTTAELSRFLVTRGVWLVFLELVVVRCLAMQFNFDYRVTLLEVIWALGWSMIALGALVWLPRTAIAAAGLAMIVGHNLFDGVRSPNPWWVFLHRPGFLHPPPDHVVFVAYPIIPWIGVTAMGFLLGQIYTWHVARRRAFLLRLAVALPCAFVAIRFVNVYGDPFRWSVQPSATHTLIAFLDATKYPPSLLFLLMTLGFTMLGLYAFDAGVPKWLSPALTFGRVPLFYFLTHLALIHLVVVAFGYVRYGAVHWFFNSPSLDKYPFEMPPGWGSSLPAIYALWAGVVILLYPLCAWFARVKARNRSAWLGYL